MHREYHPSDVHHLRAHAFEDGATDAHRESHPTPYRLTMLLGTLIGADLVFGWLGVGAWRAPWGLSLIWIAALIGAARIVYGALEGLFQGRIGADIALAQACLAAIVIGQPFVAAEVVFIALLGEVLEAVTFARTQRALHRLLEQAPRTARVRRDGVDCEIPAAYVEVDDLVIVLPGERIPVDGPVVAGRSAVDQAALTGESLPVDKGEGDEVYSGTINQFGALEIRAAKVGHDTTFGQVLRLVADAQRRKAPLERTADRLARWFLPIVEAVAAATLVAGYALGWPDVWFRTVAVLVVACPCALVLATPAAVLASIAWLARHGVLIKGGAALERLAECDTFAFDKTGTLTRGQPELAGVVAFDGAAENDVLRLAASAESASRHPLARAITGEAQRRGLEVAVPGEAEALPGAGVSAVSDGRTLLVGNARLMAERGIALGPDAELVLTALDARGETPLIIAIDGRVAGILSATDAVRPEAPEVVDDLKRMRVTEFAILTGDRASAARAVAKRTHIETVEAELLPADKARWIEERQAAGRKVAMVGDGINDAPALAGAHAGIALGGIGADLAAEAGDIVVLGEPLAVLPDLVGLSRATVRVIRQNIVLFAFGLNAVAMLSAALGVLGPVPAAILHQAGSLLVLLNAMRLLVYGDWSALPPIHTLRGAVAAIDRLDQRIDLGAVGDRVLGQRRRLARLALLAAAVVYGTWGWTAIGPEEVGLVRRQGRYAGTLGPGLHLRWPPPVETVTRLAPARVRSVEIGLRTAGSGRSDAWQWESSHGRSVAARAEDEALVMTGDGQLVELTAVAHYRLGAARPEAWRAWAFGVAGGDAALRSLAEAAVREIVGRRPLESLLTHDRHEAEERAAQLLQERADSYGLGVVISGVNFQDVHPPLAVVDAYRDVSRATSDRERRLKEAETHRAEAIASAKGKAAETVNRAEALRAVQVARAAGEADAFVYQAEARASAPALTDFRVYWDALAATLARKPKVILDGDAGRTRHLIVPGVVTGLPPPVLNTLTDPKGPPR